MSISHQCLSAKGVIVLQYGPHDTKAKPTKANFMFGLRSAKSFFSILDSRALKVAQSRESIIQ